MELCASVIWLSSCIVTPNLYMTLQCTAAVRTQLHGDAGTITHDMLHHLPHLLAVGALWLL